MERRVIHMGAVVLCIVAVAAFFIVGKSLNGINTDNKENGTKKNNKWS